MTMPHMKVQTTILIIGMSYVCISVRFFFAFRAFAFFALLRFASGCFAHGVSL